METEFFRVRTYENGNAHIWFLRDDLLRKVNQLLGEYYDAPIPEERAASEDTGFSRPKTEIAKNFAFYPSPKDVVERVVEKANVPKYPCSWRKEDGPLRILEPSAGTGNLAKPLAETGNLVDCVEYQPELANELRRRDLYNAVHCFDFLAWQPDPENLYDKVVMNPPFDRERDIDHVMHALKFLKPDGKLVAVMSAGTCFRETTKAKSVPQGRGFHERPFHRPARALLCQPGDEHQHGDPGTSEQSQKTVLTSYDVKPVAPCYYLCACTLIICYNTAVADGSHSSGTRHSHKGQTKP